MNVVIFTGRVAATPEFETYGETKVTRFRLIRNEYAGKADAGERLERVRERVVSVPFTAFAGLAEFLADYVLVGDQLVVHAAIRNNNFTDGKGIERYEYNFEVKDLEFGAPGAEKRKKLSEFNIGSASNVAEVQIIKDQVLHVGKDTTQGK